MSQVFGLELQHCTMNAIVHEARMAGAAVQQAAACYERPSAVFRPRLSVDGNQWCALYGDNLQDGVAGFGDSPADAMWDFDRNWSAKLPAKVASPPLDAMMGRKDWPSMVKKVAAVGARVDQVVRPVPELLACVRDLVGQITAFAEQHGEADFETGRATALLARLVG